MEPEGDWIYYGFWNYSGDGLLEMYDTWWDACEYEDDIGEFSLIRHKMPYDLVMIRLYEPRNHHEDNLERKVRTACYVWPYKIPLRGLYFEKRVVNPILSIQYRHPDLKVPLYYDLPEDLCLEGNELLSAAFLKRWLDYDVGRGMPFDSRYELAMIYINSEEEIETAVLKQGDYIRLLDSGLEVLVVEGKTE